MADLNAVIRAWAAKREEVPQSHIAEVEFEAEPPGEHDLGAVVISYVVVKARRWRFDLEFIADFIRELIGVQQDSYLLSASAKVQIPKNDLEIAARGLLFQLVDPRQDIHNTADTRIAMTMLERALEAD